MAQDCIFCRIVRGEAPADIVYQDDTVVAFRDIYPKAPVHVLIVPRRHIPSLAHVTPEDEPLLGHMMYVASRIAEEQGVRDSGFRTIVNTGPDGGQEIYHLHIHLLGGRPLGRMVAR